MEQLNKLELLKVSGGNNSWAENEDLLPTVVRNAGIGAMGGLLGGGVGALAGAAIGATVGFSRYHTRAGGKKRKNTDDAGDDKKQN